jgi:hypothetical protein
MRRKENMAFRDDSYDDPDEDYDLERDGSLFEEQA